MPKLTRSRLAQISEILDRSLFTSAAFEITSTNEVSAIVTIIYRDDQKYSAKLFYAKRTAKNVQESLVLGLSAEVVMMAEFAPGSFVEKERTEDTSFERFLRELESWTDRLRSEIILVDVVQRQFAAFQEDLNKKLEEHFKDPTAHFDPTESKDIKEKLREFEAKIDELTKSQQATEGQVDELRRVISDLGQAAHTLTKRAWYRTACSKLYNLSLRFFSSEAGQKVISTTIDRLLDAPKTG